MALVLADRVQETSTSTGTGPMTLAGAAPGYQSFAVVGNGNTTYYTITDTSSGDWEVGIGTYSTTGPTLTRTTVVSSSSGGSAISFGAGSKNVFITYPAEFAAYASNNPGTAGYALVSNGSGVAPSWQPVTSTSAANISGGAATYVPYQTDVDTTGFSSNFTFDGTFLGAPRHSASASISGATNTGAYSYGSLNYSDTNIVASFQSSIATYFQMIMQNSSNNAAASADYVVSNDLGTASTYYGNFGMNSSTYTGSGAFNEPNAVYVSATSGDLVLGTTTNNGVSIVVNSGATDAVYVAPSGAIAVNGSYGTSGQVLQTNGSGSAPTWINNNPGTTLGKVFALNAILGF